MSDYSKGIKLTCACGKIGREQIQNKSLQGMEPSKIQVELLAKSRPSETPTKGSVLFKSPKPTMGQSGARKESKTHAQMETK